MGVGGKQPAGGLVAAVRPPVGSRGKVPEADKISTYSFSFDALEMQIN